MNLLLQLCATPRRLLISLAAGLGLSLLVLLLLPSHLPKPHSMAPHNAAWTLAAPVTIDSDTALSVISQRRLWGAGGAGGAVPPGAQAQPDEKPLTPPDWRIAGVVSEHGRPSLLITTDGPLQPQPQTLRAGDHLPGGARILAISSDRILLALNGQRLSLSTYAQ